MTSDSRDYYEILGVSQDASFEEIRAAYIELAQRFHPSSNKSPDAPARMKEFGEANQILGNVEARQAYDHARHTLNVTDIELNRVRDMATKALWEMAFTLGFNAGSGVNETWKFLRTSAAGAQSGLWHAMFEAALGAALQDGDWDAIALAARDAAWRGPNSELVRRSIRRAFYERSSTLDEAEARDLALQIVGTIACDTGRKVGEARSPERPASYAWRAVYNAAYSVALTEFTEYAAGRTPGAAVDWQLPSMIADNATASGRAALPPYMDVVSQQQQTGERNGDGLLGGCRGWIIGLIVLWGLLVLAGSICSAIATNVAVDEANSVRAGDCLDGDDFAPTSCGQASAYHVLSVKLYPEDMAYPGESFFETDHQEVCPSLAEQYVYPPREGWLEGDRLMACVWHPP